ncbi:MAG TPA: aldehyde dehydrogenase family protein [Candidatus Lumbricidophila sp.]|nr:aldehyde dehydrogenase family protein [Candidatus Lumbricidophila sp.]
MSATSLTASIVRPESLSARRFAEAPLGALQNWVNGQSVPSVSAERVAVHNPATGTEITSVPVGAKGDVDAAVAAAKAALPGWRALTPGARAAALLELANAIEANADELATLEALNAGKPVGLASEDVAATVDTFRFMAGAVRAQRSLAAGEYLEGRTSFVTTEPLGVVGAITPWNYPILMAAWKLGPILAAGNTCVLKPAELTPITTVRLAELSKGILPDGVLNIVNGAGAIVGAALTKHPDVDMVSVTGSVRSGREVAKAAAESVKRVHLELGGKAAVMIFADANLTAAAETIRFAGFGNTGQDCGAACRVMVHESVHDEFVRELVEQVSTLVVGDPAAGDEVEMGPVVSQRHHQTILGFIDRAVAGGATVAVGGAAGDGDGWFVLPTVLTNVSADDECTSEEIFGPVVTVEKFSDEATAVESANATAYGLSASIWTESARRGIALSHQLNFGTVWVNDHLMFATEMPWGGVKMSGYGRDLSAYALDDYSRTKHVMVNHTQPAA